jgi:hypothetical protein
LGTLVFNTPQFYTGGTWIKQGTILFGGSQDSAFQFDRILVGTNGVASAGTAINQNFVYNINTASTGVVALDRDSTNSLNFGASGFHNMPNVRLGATSNSVLSGSIIPAQVGSGSSFTSGAAAARL